MENLEGHPISDFSQMAEAGLSFESLRRSVRADRNGLSSGPSRDASDQLLTRLDRVLERFLR